MASKRARKNYRMKTLPSNKDEPEHSHMMDEDEMQRMADGGIAEVLRNRGKVLATIENSAVTPTPTPVTPAPPVPATPTQVPIIPGLADQMAAKQAARLKAESEAALATPPPRKKFLGLFADGGQVGLRKYAMGGTVWPDHLAGVQGLDNMNNVADLATTGPATSPSYDASSLQTLGIRSGPQAKNPLDNSQPGYKFDRSKMLFDPKAGGPAPLVSDSMPGATGSVLSDSQWNQMGNKVNPKTGYPMLADGGPVTDNESTLRYAKKYDGPGGVRDIPAFANGGVAGNRVYGEGGPTEDKVKIRVSPGEFVLPADTVKAIGAGGLRRLIADTHTPVKAPGYGNGLTDWFTNWGKKAKAATAAGADAWAEAEKNATTAAPKTSGREPGWRSDQGSGTGVPRGTPPPGTPVGMGVNSPGMLDKARAAQTGWAGGKPINFSLPLDKAAQLTKGAARALAVPAALASTFDDAKGTDTDEYRKRFGLDNPEAAGFGTKWLSASSLPSDLIVRGLGAASDLGRVAGKVTDFFGLGNPMDSFYRDKAEAGAKPPTPGLRSTSTVDPSKTEGFGMGDRGAGVNTLAPNPKKTSFSNADIKAAPEAGPEGPSIADTNAAARAEMAAMDARTAAGNATEGLRLDEMNRRGQVAGAAWDRQVALGRKDPAMYANAVRNEELLKEGANRGLARDLKGMDTAAHLSAADKLAASAKYRDDMGLRGQMLASQTSLMGHLMDQQMTMAQLQHTMGKENAKDFQDELATRAQVFMPGKEGGPPVLDPAATAKNIANLKRFQIDPTADHLAILNAIKPGAKSINEIPREHWGSILDKALTNIGIGAATGGQGMSAKYGIKERGLSDAFAGPGRNSQVGVMSTLLNNVNPLAPPERNLTVSTETPGSLPMDSVLEDVMSGDRGRAESIIHSLRQSSNPQEVVVANKLAQRLGIR